MESIIFIGPQMSFNNCYNHGTTHMIVVIKCYHCEVRTEVYLGHHCWNDQYNHCRVVSIWSQWSLNLFYSNHSHHSDHTIWLYQNQPLFNPAQLKLSKMTTYGVPLLSLDHFFSCDSLLIRKIPLPWAEKLTQKN